MRRPRTVNKPRRIICDPSELPYLCNNAEAGLLLRMTPEQVSKLAREGVLPGAKQGQAWYFKRDDLLTYLDQLFCGR